MYGGGLDMLVGTILASVAGRSSNPLPKAWLVG